MLANSRQRGVAFDVGRTKCAYRQINFARDSSQSASCAPWPILFITFLDMYSKAARGGQQRAKNTKHLICFATELETFALSQSSLCAVRFLAWFCDQTRVCFFPLFFCCIQKTKQTHKNAIIFRFYFSQTISWVVCGWGRKGWAHRRAKRVYINARRCWVARQHEFRGIFHTEQRNNSHFLERASEKKASKLIVFSLHRLRETRPGTFFMCALPGRPLPRSWRRPMMLKLAQTIFAVDSDGPENREEPRDS